MRLNLSRWMRIVVLVLVGLAHQAWAGHVVFFEGFNFSFDNQWGTSIYAGDPDFVGSPSGGFDHLGPDDVFRMVNTITGGDFVGLSPTEYFIDPGFEIFEARFQLVGSGTSNLSDSPLVLSIISPGIGSVSVAISGDISRTQRRLRIQSFQDPLAEVSVALATDTWYWMRIDNTGPTMRGVLLSDDQSTELASLSFSLDADSIPMIGTTLSIGVTQESSLTQEIRTADVALDSLVVIEPPCVADMNGDGVLNFFDISAFLTAMAVQDPAADFNNDGAVNFFDISAFLSAFSAGCP
jgi:hypothetical protein